MGKKVTRYLLFILLFVLCGCKPSSYEPRTYVLSVGISDYLKIHDLRLPEKDAEAITRLFNNRNAEVTQLLGKGAGKEKIVSSLRAICSKAGQHDRVVFYFSGHGYKGGLCPYDMSEKTETGLKYEEVFAVFKQCKAEFKIIMADACFSGSIRVATNEENSDSRQQLADANVVIFQSSRSNETSIESPFMAHGIFTNCLIRGLRGGADANRDKCISAKELFDFVSHSVIDKSKDRQHPVMWGKFSDDAVIIDWH